MTPVRQALQFITSACLIAMISLMTLPAHAAHTFPTEWTKPYNAVYETLRRNLKKPSEKVPYFHARPAPKFDGIYLWDSAFISLVWNNWNTTVAQDVVRSVVHGQQKDGRIPHVINIWGTSEWTQPPVLAWASARVAARSGDVKFVKDIYPKLRRYHAWLLNHRRLSSGLFFWQHPYESGIDNSPRFGARDESKFIDTREVESVDMSSYVVMDARALISLAKILLDSGTPIEETVRLGQDIAEYSREIDEIGQLIRTRLWDEKSGYFYDRNIKTGQLIEIPTIASFFPMTAKVATAEQAARLSEHLKNPDEFNTPIPFPTVARNHPTFEKDCWRGPVWINTAYLVIQGMKEYGQNTQAKNMAFRLVSGVYKTWSNTGKFVEYYDPERLDFKKLTRKKGVGLFDFFSGSENFKKFLTHLFAKQIFLGTKPVSGFIGWTGLVNTIVHEDLYPVKAPDEAPRF